MYTVQSIKEEAELVKTDLALHEVLDTTDTVQNNRQRIVNELEKHFENSYSVGNTVVLDNGYEIFVTEKEEIIVRKYDESDVATIVASHTTEKWQEEVDSTAWVNSNLNTTETERAGIPIPVGFSLLEGTIDTGIVIINNDTNDEFVWIPVDNKAKATVTFKSKNDLKTVTGPTGAMVNINGRTATVEFTTEISGIYEFYAEDKNGNKKYYDVEIGGINLAQEYFSNQYDFIIYRENATEAQKERALYRYYSNNYGYEIASETDLIKRFQPSLWENWDDVVRGYYYEHTSLEDWYYNWLDPDEIIDNATTEQMQQAVIDDVNTEYGTSATTLEDVKTVFSENYYNDEEYKEITTLSK